ncbi:MAG: MBL fold metallo-hydrolase [Ruminococcus sp.]|nr:MBL fold metallo-hydrolase [Ruminococcus sp.]
MSRICPLYSSSSGNSTFLGGAKGGILIDTGVSCKRICEALQSLNVSPEAITGILITHEHSDHIKGLLNFTKKYHTPIFTGLKTAEYLTANNLVSPDSTINVFSDEKEFCVDNFEIHPFKTPHDSRESFGFRIKNPEGKIVVSCTDLGNVTQVVHKNLLGASVCLIEANYDERMLNNGRYPYFLKERIKSNHGHLSNKCCADEIETLIQNGTDRIILGHLSQENNSPYAARRAVETTLCDIPEDEYQLFVAPAGEPGQEVEI